MRIQLIKEIKMDGDIFYAIYMDGEYQVGTLQYGGHVEKNNIDELHERLLLAQEKYQDYKNCLYIPMKEVILEEDIIYKNKI